MQARVSDEDMERWLMDTHSIDNMYDIYNTYDEAIRRKMRGLQLLNSDESLQEGEVRNDELQGVSITHLWRVNNISLHNFCNYLRTQEEQAVRGKENVEGGGQSGSRSTPHTGHIAQHAAPFANRLLECEPVTQGWKDGAHRAAWPGEKNVKGGINQVADRPRILVIMPSTLRPLLIDFWEEA